MENEINYINKCDYKILPENFIRITNLEELKKKGFNFKINMTVEQIKKDKEEEKE